MFDEKYQALIIKAKNNEKLTFGWSNRGISMIIFARYNRIEWQFRISSGKACVTFIYIEAKKNLLLCKVCTRSSKQIEIERANPLELTSNYFAYLSRFIGTAKNIKFILPGYRAWTLNYSTLAVQEEEVCVEGACSIRYYWSVHFYCVQEVWYRTLYKRFWTWQTPNSIVPCGCSDCWYLSFEHQWLQFSHWSLQVSPIH